ncbi:MAG: hypothetical protein OXH42_05390 [Acidimicrobiaceae bacterium]|nr:hypothetical protein [Acidimicrobiaceae bacterium]MDE0676752.1 hypothetical protein [Acidimicrobiaceae bacterium]
MTRFPQLTGQLAKAGVAAALFLLGCATEGRGRVEPVETASVSVISRDVARNSEDVVNAHLRRFSVSRGDAGESSPPSGDEGISERVSSLDAALPASFAGMWDYDPEVGGHAFDLCGYLVIEEPYVHVLATETGYRPLPNDMHQELPRRGDGDVLYFMLMLPHAQTRYDPSTRSLWVNGDGPFADGDHVSAVGVRGTAADLDADSVHERLPWRTMGMLRAEDEFGCNDSPRTRADRAVEAVPSLAEAPPAVFEGMWDHDPADGGDMAELCGYLIIEEPYVHVLQTERDWGQGTDPGLARSESGSLLYSMLMLPRPGTRYDVATRSLWVYDEGPMTDGDHVSVGGGVGRRQPDWPGPNVHQRGLWQTNSMGPTDYPC